MRFGQLFSLAWRNIRCHRRVQIQVFFGVLLSVTLITTIAAYSFTIRAHLAAEAAPDTPCFLSYDPEEGEADADRLRQTAAEACGQQRASVCLLTESDYFESLLEQENSEPLDLQLQNTVLCLGDTVYPYAGSNLLLERYQMQPLPSVVTIDRSVSDFSTYANALGKEPFFCGGDAQTANEVILPEQYLALYGVPEQDYMDCIGQPLTLRLQEPSGVALLDGVRVCGVARAECFAGFAPAVLRTTDRLDSSDLLRLNVYFHDFDHDTLETAWQALDRASGMRGTVCPAYSRTVTLMEQASFVNRVLLLTACLVTAAILLHLIAYLRFYLAQQKKNSALLLSLGMRPADVSLLHLLETAVVSLFAALCGAGFALLLSQIADGALNAAYVIEPVSVLPLLPLVPVALLGAAVPLSAAVGLLTYTQCRKLSPARMFSE